MKDLDDRKSFIIPKTSASTEDVLISEKANSRNVTELFADVRVCALDNQFDFGQGHCQSCDSIRNPKLLKLYNDKRTQMKKDKEPMERLAFHLVSNRDVALTIAKEGLRCKQLSFKIDKYLGNPHDGIHLCRRPDVLLRASNKREGKGFGLLICKVLLGRGYVTVPSTVNNQLAAQLHYDYHFCKTQPTSKEPPFTSDSLAKSLIFCYEHQNFETLDCPTQILPIAVLWYALPEKFLFQSPSRSRIPQPLPQNLIQRQVSAPPAVPIRAINPPISSTSSMTATDLTNVVPIGTSTPMRNSRPSILTNQPASRFDSFRGEQSLIGTQGARMTQSAETIPLSEQKPACARSQSNQENKPTPTKILHNAMSSLDDPRLATFKHTRTVFYLEPNAVKHALQQQKRLKTYFLSASQCNTRTTYTVIPLITQTEEDYPPLCVSVTDCFHFGFQQTGNQIYIDLEDDENQLAYEELQISDRQTEQDKKSCAKADRLRARHKWQDKPQEAKETPDPCSSSPSEMYREKGRTLLESHTLLTPFHNQLSSQLVNFFSYEYRHENRPHIQDMLAELMGVLVEKYPFEHQTTEPQGNSTPESEVEIVEPVPVTAVIDMDLDCSAGDVSGDRDERFPMPEPPGPIEKPVDQPGKEAESTLSALISIAKGNIDQPVSSTNPVARTAFDDALHKLFKAPNNQSMAETRPKPTMPNVKQRTEGEPIGKRVKPDTKTVANSNVVDSSLPISNQIRHQPAMNGMSKQPSLLVPITNRALVKNPTEKQKKISSVSYSKRLRRINQVNPSINRQRPSFPHQSTAESLFSTSANITVDQAALNYRSFQTNNYPGLMESYPIPTPLMITHSHVPSPHFGEPTSNYPYYSDNYHAPLSSIPPLMSTTSVTNLPNSFNAQPSDTIERLQLFLQNRPSTGELMPLMTYQQHARPSMHYSSTTSSNSNIYL